MILLDTDILTFVLFDGHSRVSERMRTAAEPPVTSIISRIEVLQGRFDAVLKAADGVQLLKAQERLKATEAELARYAIVPLDDAAATEFERLDLDKKYRKMGRADLLIACIALANRATLVTRNMRHFRQVPGLKLENWAD
jgi:tRNA(fMet)-specific endonuclease VapC